MNRKIAILLASLVVALGLGLPATPAAVAASNCQHAGCTTGWLANSCYDTDYRAVVNVNIDVDWNGNNTRTVRWSGSIHLPPDQGGYHYALTLMHVWHKLVPQPESAYVLRIESYPGPAYGSWDVATLYMTHPTSVYAWKVTGDWGGATCAVYAEM